MPRVCGNFSAISGVFENAPRKVAVKKFCELQQQEVGNWLLLISVLYVGNNNNNNNNVVPEANC